MTDQATRSPAIFRCQLCGGIVHPPEPERPAAWCSRCRRPVPVIEDGGGRT